MLCAQIPLEVLLASVLKDLRGMVSHVQVTDLHCYMAVILSTCGNVKHSRSLWRSSLLLLQSED